MKFADFICGEAISAHLAADDKEAVIAEIVQSLVKAGKISEGDQGGIISAVMKREELGSTGIGRGWGCSDRSQHRLVEFQLECGEYECRGIGHCNWC